MSQRNNLRAYMSGPEYERFVSMYPAPRFRRQPIKWLRHKLSSFKEKREARKIIDAFEKREKTDAEMVKVDPRDGKVVWWEDVDPDEKWPSGIPEEKDAAEKKEEKTIYFPTNEDMKKIAAETRRLLNGRKPSMLGPDEMEEILAYTKSLIPEERAAALHIIAGRRDKSHRDIALSMIGDDSMIVSSAAFFAVSRIGGAESVKTLIRLLQKEKLMPHMLWPVYITVWKIRESGGIADVIDGIHAVMGMEWFKEAMENKDVVYKTVIDAINNLLSDGKGITIFEVVDYSRKEQKIPWWLQIPSMGSRDRIPGGVLEPLPSSMRGRLRKYLSGSEFLHHDISSTRVGFMRTLWAPSRMRETTVGDPDMKGVPAGLLKDVPDQMKLRVANEYLDRQLKMRRRLLLKRLTRKERKAIEKKLGKRIKTMTLSELLELGIDLHNARLPKLKKIKEDWEHGAHIQRSLDMVVYCPTCAKPNLRGQGICSNKSCNTKIY